MDMQGLPNDFIDLMKAALSRLRTSLPEEVRKTHRFRAIMVELYRSLGELEMTLPTPAWRTPPHHGEAPAETQRSDPQPGRTVEILPERIILQPPQSLSDAALQHATDLDQILDQSQHSRVPLSLSLIHI